MRIWMSIATLFLVVGQARADDGFWRTWGDGKAELDGYTLTEPRYGEPRQGIAVLIYVTEDFSDSARVKADPGKHPKPDVEPVLKLNFLRQFQTGIYDYGVLTSTFLRTERPGFPVSKVSFSAQEWCGHVYQQWLARGDRLVGSAHSYFDGEADQSLTLPLPEGGVMEEQLPVLVRGLRGDLLRPGEAKSFPFLPSVVRARFSHKPQAWGRAKLTRGAVAAPFASGVGTLPASVWTLAEEGGETTEYVVEEAAPHRLLGWSRSDGEKGLLRGSARLPYWALNQPGGEKHLIELGLTARDFRGLDTAPPKPSKPKSPQRDVTDPWKTR